MSIDRLCNDACTAIAQFLQPELNAQLFGELDQGAIGERPECALVRTDADGV